MEDNRQGIIPVIDAINFEHLEIFKATQDSGGLIFYKISCQSKFLSHLKDKDSWWHKLLELIKLVSMKQFYLHLISIEYRFAFHSQILSKYPAIVYFIPTC